MTTYTDRRKACIDRVREALPEFAQQDDYLLAHGASLMSESSHEIIHVDTLRKIVDAVLTTPAAAPQRHSWAVDGMRRDPDGNWILAGVDAAVAQGEKIYQLQQVNGAWLDVSKEEFDAIACNYGRVVCTPLPRASDAPATAAHAGATLTDEQRGAIQFALCFMPLDTADRKAVADVLTGLLDAPMASAVPADLLPNALWTRRGSGTCEWWSFKGYEARKDSVDQWVLRKAGEELYRHTHLQVVMAHAEREILAAAKPVSDPVAPRKCPNCGQVTEPGTAHAVDASHRCRVISTAGIVAQGAKPVSVDAGGMTFEQWYAREYASGHVSTFTHQRLRDCWQAARASMPERGAVSDAAIGACALMIKGICMTHPQDVWTAEIKERICYMLKTPPTESTGEPNA